ncbi:SAF domain-containing protein [Embleya sp. NBC_00896]|uniref:SAF domain-containing protein n=1 Tax=Embleya sp. NBC_00896 TaxID=2975961 RepID=UPI002F911EBC|nr:SAF domain-containing protein [Embleya sp. NBC_00896]
MPDSAARTGLNGGRARGSTARTPSGEVRRGAAKKPPAAVGERRRRRGWLWGGIALVVVAGLVFALLAQRLGDRHTVLALSRPVPAGQVIADGDLRRVQVAEDGGLGLFRDGDRAQVVGRVALVPLEAGALLQRSFLGETEAFPPAGRAVVSVSIKPGGAPAQLREGQRVAVMEAAQPAAAAGTAPASEPPAARVVATVVTVGGAAANTQDFAVSLLVEIPASRVVTAMREPRLVVLPATTAEVP